MLESFLKVIGEYGNPVPRYTGPRCLVERLAVGGCDLCQQICPHEAITIDARVEINDTRCTGCGLCTQVCPSGALEFDVTAALGAVREQTVPERRSVDGSVDDGAKLVCSQAGESGKTLPCLARVTSSLIVAAGAWDTPLELVHGDCADCKLGGPQVPQELQKVVEQAQQLRLATGRPAQVTVRRGNGEGAGGEAVSRRGCSDPCFARRAVWCRNWCPINPCLSSTGACRKNAFPPSGSGAGGPSNRRRRRRRQCTGRLRLLTTSASCARCAPTSVRRKPLRVSSRRTAPSPCTSILRRAPAVMPACAAVHPTPWPCRVNGPRLTSRRPCCCVTRRLCKGTVQARICP